MSPKKSLGQNFLRDPKILKKIVDFAHIEPADTVVEIGPGEGTLTKILLERCGRLIAIEKDEQLANELKGRLRGGMTEKLEVIHADVLKLETGDLDLKASGYKLVGNIPYYITGAIFEKFLSDENRPRSITFVTQKEVADRIIARDGKESILSISIKLYGTPEYGGIIKAGSFFPAPKVDSGIISIRNIQKPAVNEKRFFEILKMGFAHKRKLLAKNLDIREEILEGLSIPAKARAEDLSIENWITLAKELE